MNIDAFKSILSFGKKIAIDVIDLLQFVAIFCDFLRFFCDLLRFFIRKLN